MEYHIIDCNHSDYIDYFEHNEWLSGPTLLQIYTEIWYYFIYIYILASFEHIMQICDLAEIRKHNNNILTKL